MKKQLHILLAIAVVLMGLTACKKSTKEMLIGTWRYSKTISTDEGKITMEGTEIFDNDGTVSGNVTATITGETEVEDYTVQAKINVKAKLAGDWILNEKEIAYSPTSAEVEVTSIRYYDPSSGQLLAELTGRELKQASNIFAGEMKTSLMEASTERIIMIQEKKFVTEQESEDGDTKTTITYHRVR